jgi:hypothetical protein
MRGSESPLIDVGALLEKVEAAAPIDAVEAVAAALGEMVHARSVALLIADFSGRAVVRLTSSTGGVEGARSRGVEQAKTLPLRGPSTSACSGRSRRTSRPSMTGRA